MNSVLFAIKYASHYDKQTKTNTHLIG